MVADLQKAAAEINRLMEKLDTQSKLVQSMSSGQAVEGFTQAALLWKNRGLGESNRTAAVAAKSDEYSQNMHQVDGMAARDLMT
jgi:hypothetical protein